MTILKNDMVVGFLKADYLQAFLTYMEQEIHS